MTRARQTLCILGLTALAVLGWQWFAGRFLPRPALAESNFHANRLRLEGWFLEPVPSNVLVGSSISGRLLPGHFAGTSLAGLANLGLDGSGPLTALDCVLTRITNGGPAPRRVFVEIHRLDRTNDANDRLLLESARGFSMKLAGVLPAIRAASRPSTVAYAWLKDRQPGGAIGDGRPLGDDRKLIGEPDWLRQSRDRVDRLRALGVEVVLLRLPVGRENPVDSKAPNFADEVAGRLGISLIDLNRRTAPAGTALNYSDGLHLTADSARTVARILAQSAP
jgi:hypothetical protein